MSARILIVDDSGLARRNTRRILEMLSGTELYGERFAAYSIDVRGSTAMTDFAGRRTTEGSYAREALVLDLPMPFTGDRADRCNASIRYWSL